MNFGDLFNLIDFFSSLLLIQPMFFLLKDRASFLLSVFNFPLKQKIEKTEKMHCACA